MARNHEHVQFLDAKAFVFALGEEIIAIFELYVLAEKLQDPSAQDAAMVAILDLSEHTHDKELWFVPPYSAVRTVYANTPEGSPARRLVVDLCSNAPVEVLRRLHDVKPEAPREFLCDLMIAIRNEAPATFANRAKRNTSKAYLQTQEVATDPQSPSKETSTSV